MHNCRPIFLKNNIGKNGLCSIYQCWTECVSDPWLLSEGTWLNLCGITSCKCSVVKSWKPHTGPNLSLVIFVAESFQHKSWHSDAAIFSHLTQSINQSASSRNLVTLCKFEAFFVLFCFLSLCANLVYLKSYSLCIVSSCIEVDLRVQGVGVGMPRDFLLWYELELQPWWSFLLTTDIPRKSWGLWLHLPEDCWLPEGGPSEHCFFFPLWFKRKFHIFFTEYWNLDIQKSHTVIYPNKEVL